MPNSTPAFAPAEDDTPDTLRPEHLVRAASRRIGGSAFEPWNTLLAKQVFQTLGIGVGDNAAWEMQKVGAVSAHLDLGSKDEREAMMVAQSLAAHNAVMDCYRWAML